MADIVVLGAGVSGLTTALLLLRAGHNVTIVAKHMPGDYDIEYASPWAGANYLPMSKPGTPANTYERETFPELVRLAQDVPQAGIHFQEARELFRAKDANTPIGKWFEETLRPDAWFKDIVPNFRLLDRSELPPGIDGGSSFTSVCINTALYLPWLASECLGLGGTLRRGVVAHVSDAAQQHHSGRRADVVVNCTGLSSLRLGGVADTKLYPGRGQIVVVRNEHPGMRGTSGTDDAPDELFYLMQRAAGGGTVLGGCMQVGNWESQPDPDLALRIMKRAVDFCPGLVAPGKGVEGLSVIRHSVGLRPMREGGIRMEREVIDGVAVVHNYGHAGYGYQTSYGAARAAKKLVEDGLTAKARL